MNKFNLALSAALFFSLLLFPLISTGNNAYMAENRSAKSAAATVKATASKTTAKNEEKTEKIHLKLAKNGKIIDIDILEYLTGVLAAEIDASYETEAIKAQAVAAHTMALYRKNENSDKDYDVTDDPSADQGYIDVSARREKWGDSFDKNESKISKAVIAVMSKTITYKDKPILAAYCDISGGKTESAKNVWGVDLPYLQPVESVGDMLAEKYISTVTYTKDEFSSIASALDIKLKGDADSWVGSSSCSDSGTVQSIKLGGKSFTGAKIRSTFSLRSANFDIEYSGGKFIFTVRGNGHGVGMSQYGANYMAKKGSKYDEIIQWYYTNVQISG